MEVEHKEAPKGLIDSLFKVGAHLGYSRARRHASMAGLVFGSKGKTDVLDLTKTSALMEESLSYVRSLGALGKTMLFVAGKPEILDTIKTAAGSVGMPYVAGRWIGGTISNFPEIKKRIDRLHELVTDREAGNLVKYTKKERVLIDREIARLEENFGGLGEMARIPDAVVIVDTRAEAIAVKEAKKMHVPVVGIMNSDCDMSLVPHPLVGNDSSRESVAFFLTQVVEAYREGQKGAVAKAAETPAS